jgi:hypothetical protein
MNQSRRRISCDLNVGAIQEYEVVCALINFEIEGGSSQVYLGSPLQVISHLLDGAINVILDLLGDT